MDIVQTSGRDNNSGGGAKQSRDGSSGESDRVIGAHSQFLVWDSFDLLKGFFYASFDFVLCFILWLCRHLLDFGELSPFLLVEMCACRTCAILSYYLSCFDLNFLYSCIGYLRLLNLSFLTGWSLYKLAILGLTCAGNLVDENGGV